jgi:hypothetical protein
MKDSKIFTYLGFFRQFGAALRTNTDDRSRPDASPAGEPILPGSGEAVFGDAEVSLGKPQKRPWRFVGALHPPYC